MAHTAIRLGYLSTSGGGNGAGFQEFTDLASFPPIGQLNRIYLAADTEKLYKWDGSSYVEISPSEVTSVNTQVGDVVLDKSDIGLDQVDNTSDLNKPISTATQTALDLITDVNWTGDYNNGVTYTVGDGVMFNGASFRMIAAIGAAGYAPPAYPANWIQVTDYVSANDIGLGNVDNTSDLDKPISSATQTALNAKEDTSNKSIDGTLAANSDTLYPSQKAVKTYVDAASTSVQNQLDASTYYHELHVNYDYTGTVVDGSPYKPFKTIQAAVNAAQLQTIGGNTAILVHLKKDITMVEDIIVNNAVSNLYIMPAVYNNTDSSPLKIVGSLTISGSSTNRVRVQDIEFTPTSGYALIVNDTNGRHMFQNCQFKNGSIPGQAGTGVNLTSTYRNFIEFIDCTIEGTVNIAGNPVAGTTVTMYRSRLTYANVIVNSPNIAVGMYDTYSIYGITHTAGALSLVGLWGITGFFNSTANVSATNFISLSNLSLQKYDLTFVPLNKTGTCLYQLINVHRGETADVLNGTRAVFGPTATDAGYKMGVSGNWSPAVSNVAGALDQLAANKISTSQKGVANGVAPLNSSAKIDSTYLPSYVDDVVEYANLAAFPIIGETGKIYIALDTNLCYRWSGSVYVEISPAPVLSVNGQTNVVVLDSDDLANQQAVPAYWDIADGSTVKAHLDELALRREAQNNVTNEPTGFATRTESTTSFSDSGPDRTFAIAPVGASFEFYVKGIKFTKTSAETIQIPNLAGNHFIFYNASGILSSTQVASSVLFKENALLSVVYWNTETSTHSYFAEERHGLVMDGETHSYLHTVFGAQYLSGLALQGFTVNGNGSLAAHAQFVADEGTIRDEDLLLTLAAQTEIPVLFRQGSLWRKKTADSFPVIYSGTAGYTGASGRLPYNQLVSGSWQLTEIANNDFVLVHIFATNDKETPIVAIQGTATYLNVTAARLAASTEITSLSGLPFAEFVALGSVVFESSNSYTNTPKARTRSINGGDYVDFRGTQLYTAAGVATNHGLLSGLSNDDHIQYHTDARGDVRYYTKAQVDSLIAGIASPGDIDEKSYSFSNSQVVPESVTDFAFSNALVRSFNAIVSVKIDADSDLYEVFELHGIQKGSEWDLSISSSGDNTGIMFSVTNSGQLQYTSQNYTGFVSGTMKFRAITTSA
jgi:hypothetical protein